MHSKSKSARFWQALALVVCPVIGHPPSTYGDVRFEDPILQFMAQADSDWAVTVEVSCLCGRKMVPFRASERA